MCPGTAESAVVCSVLPSVCVLFLMHAGSLEVQAHLILLLLLCCVHALPGTVSNPCAGAALQEMALGSSLYGTFGKEIEVELLACPKVRKAVSSTGSQSCPGG